VKIRDRRESDTEALRLAERVHELDGYPPYLPDGDYRALLFGHGALGAWVADIDGAAVGQVTLHLRTARAAMALAADALGAPAHRLGVVARLLVSPDHRQQGSGAELLFAAARAAVDRGLFPMLDVAVTLPSAVALYERCGWGLAGDVTALLPNGPLAEHVYIAPEWLRPARDTRPDGGPRRWDGPPIDAWEPWSPLDVTAAMADSSACWVVVGGRPGRWPSEPPPRGP
jgi:GNAT superfamily N-acetyltransferase